MFNYRQTKKTRGANNRSARFNLVASLLITGKNKSHGRQAVSGKEIKKRRDSDTFNRVIRVLASICKPRLITGVLILSLLILAYSEINISQIKPVRSVKIEGEFKFIDKQQLLQRAEPVVEGGFFKVNLSAVRHALIAMPWVEDVSVRRQWPDQLLVRVTEKQAVCYWGEKGVLSSRGELFYPNEKINIKLPHLTGPKGQHKFMLRELARMQSWLLETGLKINKMELNARRSWILVMSNGMELRLGREQMHERLNRFVSVYNHNLQIGKRKIKHIDMRYTNGFSVAWGGV